MADPAPLVASFRAALDEVARARFDDDASLAATLAEHRARACVAYADVVVEAELFGTELARRLGPDASPAVLAHVRADHVHLAIACAAGDARASRHFEAEFLDEIDASARRLRARPDQAADVRGHLSKILFVSEPGRPAALSDYSGRGDLRSYLRVMAIRELVRVINKGRREVGITEAATTAGKDSSPRWIAARRSCSAMASGVDARVRVNGSARLFSSGFCLLRR